MLQRVQKVPVIPRERSDRGNPFPQENAVFSQNSIIAEHFGERIATPVCALARNDRFFDSLKHLPQASAFFWSRVRESITLWSCCHRAGGRRMPTGHPHLDGFDSRLLFPKKTASRRMLSFLEQGTGIECDHSHCYTITYCIRGRNRGRIFSKKL